MPMKPKRPCSFPGCPNLTDRRFCPEHEKLEAQRYERYDRDPATKRRYGRAWKRIRDSYAAEHPLCEVCLAKGVYTPTEEIHHKLPLTRRNPRPQQFDSPLQRVPCPDSCRTRRSLA